MTTRIVSRLSAILTALTAISAPALFAGAVRPGQVESGGAAVRPIMEGGGPLSGTPSVSCDAEGLMRKVYVGLSDLFKNFSENERCRAASLAVRMQPGEPLEAVLAFASANIGGLEITSDPGGAVIQVNGYRLAGGTGMRAITTVGEKTVRLSLDGYPDQTATVVVEPARWVTLHRDMKRP